MSGAPPREALPEGVLVAYYGDDFTGSTDVMEMLTFAGLPTILFLAEPTDADIAALSGWRAVGVAGTARSRPPDLIDFVALQDGRAARSWRGRAPPGATRSCST